MLERDEAVKVALNEVVESVRDFSERIIEHADGYTMSEIELAHQLRLCVIFYKARERGEEIKLPTIAEINEMVHAELSKRDVKSNEEKQDAEVSTPTEWKGTPNCS